MEPLLTVDDLHTSFFTRIGEVRAVRGISFSIDPGESLGIVGESGCGKSASMLSILRLLDDAGRVTAGTVHYRDTDLRTASEKTLETIRGKEIGMVFQDPMTSLNPVLSIGDQLTEHLRKHERISRTEAQRRALDMLLTVGIPNARERLRQYPIAFSGGMRQRVGIAIALIANPRLIIADEPTTALDVTIQAQILQILKRIRDDRGTAVMLITHDLGIVAGMCDRVQVMYGGLIVERGSVRDIFHDPRHPYTQGLLAGVPNPKEERPGRLVPIPGQPPNLLDPPAGCPFAPRCPAVMEVCVRIVPRAFSVRDGHSTSCWLEHPHARGRSGERTV